MTKQRIEKLMQESERMIEKLQKNPRLKPIYEDVNFRRIIEDGKTELSLREITFTELTPEEQGYVDFIFS